MVSVGIAGFGRMGRAMATRLATSEYQVAAWSRNGIESDGANLTGIDVCPDIASLVQRSDIILVSVLDDRAVANVLDQLCHCDLSGTLIVETSTVSPDPLRDHAKTIADKGGQAIDAPVSGGPDMIVAGEAGLYIGGAAEHVASFMPVASVLSNRIVHVGEIGAGYAAKIVNNMMLAGFWQTLKESMQVGAAHGLDLETMMDVLLDSPAANGALKHRAPVILGTSDDVGFSVAGAVKDTALFLESARRLGIDTPAQCAALDSFEACADAGHANADLAVMVREATTP